LLGIGTGARIHDHAVVQPPDGVRSGLDEGERKEGVHDAGNPRNDYGDPEAERAATMAKIRLADAGGMFREELQQHETVLRRFQQGCANEVIRAAPLRTAH
jgi:hypothetical protein